MAGLLLEYSAEVCVQLGVTGASNGHRDYQNLLRKAKWLLVRIGQYSVVMGSTFSTCSTFCRND
jgi:hypothetical protein